MRFFEFNDFGYYALIGADSEEKAIEFYEETVAEIQDTDLTPEEITQREARKKLMSIHKTNEEKIKAFEEFFKTTEKSKEPYLILIDGSLI